MSIQSIAVPDSINKIPLSAETEALIDTANEAIEAFLLADTRVIENFVTCDFYLLAQAIHWIEENHLLTGRRFCELGSGFGVGALLAADNGMESVGIEIEPVLTDQSNDLAEHLGSSAKFYCGSFVPRGVTGLLELGSDIKHVDTTEDDVFDEIGYEMSDYDLFFAFPWPGEHIFFEAVFDACASDGAMLLTYQGREGMKLVRKG
ncbi:hypothetical protein [Planctomycetes bacterium K23_9]|uniref:Methyltransferase n=1 Tax=Stieleria marina TaxID=1930275 RepID=A0A517NWA6_9BACT|nr:hypothetical protein K239x_34120 [Planctomycetes bacterium K23_9]